MPKSIDYQAAALVEIVLRNDAIEGIHIRHAGTKIDIITSVMPIGFDFAIAYAVRKQLQQF